MKETRIEKASLIFTAIGSLLFSGITLGCFVYLLILLTSGPGRGAAAHFRRSEFVGLDTQWALSGSLQHTFWFGGALAAAG